MIPKKIHYCWFGDSHKSRKIKKCIKSWKKYCPGYEIIEWNDDNVDFSDCEFAKDAYKEKAWAFVSDYVRLKVIYENGGIYLDTDVELIKNLDQFLNNSAYIGFETKETVTTGLGYGAERGNPVIKEMMDYYKVIRYRDSNGNIIRQTSPEVSTKVLLNHGLKIPDKGMIQELNDIMVFPSDYFCPKDYYSEVMSITDNTVSIHHYVASWMDKKHRFKQKKFAFLYKLWLYPWRIIRRNKVFYFFAQKIKNIRG